MARAGAWFRGTQTRGQGNIRSGGLDRDVTFVIDTDPALNNRIDAAYRSKYRQLGVSLVGGVVNPASRASTHDRARATDLVIRGAAGQDVAAGIARDRFKVPFRLDGTACRRGSLLW